VQVDRAVADRAAAGQRHGRLARTGEQRAEHQDRGAHLADDVIGGDGRGQPAGSRSHDPAEIVRAGAFDRSRGAELVEQMAEAVDIGEPRQVAQRQRLIGQQRAGHQRKRGILGAGNGDFSGQAVSAADEDTVHGRASNRSARARKRTVRESALIDFNALIPRHCFAQLGWGKLKRGG
jgi:hypothetical protein